MLAPTAADHSTPCCRNSILRLRPSARKCFICSSGAPDEQFKHFLAEGRKRRMEFRQHGVLWSAAVGASIQRCVAALTKLYDRALRYHAHSVAVATTDLAPSLFPFCDRSILLADRNPDGEGSESSTTGRRRGRSHKVGLLAPEVSDR